MESRWNRTAAARLARGSFALISIWFAAAMVATRAGWTMASAALELPFALICHRIPERVMSIGGTPMPLCSRCAGIWLGISVAASLAWPALSLRVLRVLVPAAMALLLIDIALQDLGVHPVWHSTRLLTGLLLGVPMGGAVGALIHRELFAGAPESAPR
jgi:uncharacterized membrane protein